MQLHTLVIGAVSTVVSIVAPTAMADQSTHAYWLRSYPSQAPACHQVARQLGERLAATYGVTVSRATCNAPSDGAGVDVKIEYQAEEPLALVSTQPGLSVRIEAGWFATAEECDAALPGEAAHFAATTGLSPFATYCYADGLARDYPWVPRIDAFGTTAMPPRYDGTLLFGSPVGHTRSTFEATIFDALVARDIDVRRVTVANVSGYATVTAIYYATARLPLETGEFGAVGTSEQCAAQLDVLRAIYAEDTTPALALFCANAMLGGSELQGIFLGDLGFSTSVSIETFESYAGCEADRERLIGMYQGMGRDIAGGVCTYPTDPTGPRAWAVTLFER
jgi:hypothetical protein